MKNAIKNFISLFLILVFLILFLKNSVLIMFSGSGLGLMIAKELMQTHGGEIYLQFPPAPPYRTQFILTFPLSD
ncbi:ATP-binding protein [Streptococcus chenjunshii]|uniref:histidine kinase n=1 Tax=Streptococcus chenjunshii TaxID=2173853 RepID=A0A372KMF7_9STRE|nr:ATP-binding protein [Streptococcus chenjunshii]AXQ78173.1 ATP-binding protein [Streptococcus chenjunshii]RFU50682.1 ATP-binding protein [Streptococcus chenjunshii]RFU53453.1 ATP-binding protein [Streptococcus chenjunshii]